MDRAPSGAASSGGWEAPSASVTSAVHRIATEAMREPSSLFSAVQSAVIRASSADMADDPTLVEATRDSVQANVMHWLTRVADDPARPVKAARTRAGAQLSRDLVSRGLADDVTAAFRAGQEAAWERWMELCFESTDEPNVLREVLSYSSRLISAYVGASVASLDRLVDAERARLTHRSDLVLAESVRAVLSGSAEALPKGVTYDMGARHLAVVLWMNQADSDRSLETAAATVVRATRARHSLTVRASAGTLWLWCAVPTEIDHASVLTHVPRTAGVHVAVGNPGRSVFGFRSSHEQALIAQRLVIRRGGEPTAVSYDEIALAALALTDPIAARGFAVATLGDSLMGDEVLLETLRAYLRSGANSTTTASALFVHRNTVLKRLDRIQQILPVALDAKAPEIATAIEILRWMPPGVTG